MRMFTARRGGLLGVVTAALVVGAALPAAAAPGDGSAYGASANLTLLGAGAVTVGPLAPASTAGPTDNSVASAAVPNVLSVGAVTTSARLDELTGVVTARATTGDVTIGVFGPQNIITATAVEATCTATEAGNVGTTTLTNVSLGSRGAADASPAANTTIDLSGIASITLNEQIVNADGSLTVNAIHIRLLGGTLSSVGTGDVIIASATCGPAALPTPMASGVGLWISLGLLATAVVGAAVTASRRRARAAIVVPA
jgi:hypothetical protein